MFGQLNQAAIFPNPFTEKGLSFNLPAFTSYPVAYTIFDMQGMVVSRGTLEHAGAVIPGTGIAPGTYGLSIGGYRFTVVKL